MGEQFSQGCPAHSCRLLGCPHCLVFTSPAGTQERDRLQALGYCLWELCCTFYPEVLEDPRDEDLRRCLVLLHST